MVSFCDTPLRSCSPEISEILRVDFFMRQDALSNAMRTLADVALIVWNPDVIQLLAFVLRKHDLECIGTEPSQGVEAIEPLIRAAAPSVVVFDLAPPYTRSATVVQHLMERFSNYSFVMTCADPILALKSAPFLARYPVFQKPYELNEIASTIESMTRRLPQCSIELSHC